MNNPFEPINARLNNLEALVLEMLQLLRSSVDNQNNSDADEAPLNVQQASEFLNISRQTVYQNIAKIPHRKRHGKLHFFRSELKEYLNRAA